LQKVLWAQNPVGFQQFTSIPVLDQAS